MPAIVNQRPFNLAISKSRQQVSDLIAERHLDPPLAVGQPVDILDGPHAGQRGVVIFFRKNGPPTIELADGSVTTGIESRWRRAR